MEKKKEKPEKKIYIPLINENICKINPALDFTDDNVYVNIWLDAKAADDDDAELVFKPFWLSDNTLIDENELRDRQIILKNKPEPIMDRISHNLIAYFLNGAILGRDELKNAISTNSTALPNLPQNDTVLYECITTLVELVGIGRDTGALGLFFGGRDSEKGVFSGVPENALPTSTISTNIYKIPHKTPLLDKTSGEFIELLFNELCIEKDGKIAKNALPTSTISTFLPRLIFKMVKHRLDFYFEFPDEHTSTLVALWAMGTYFFPLFKTYGYLYIHGAKRSGKSQLLSILEKVCFNSRYAQELNSSNAFRIISSTQCTLLIDETDEFVSMKDNAELINILRSGYKSGVVIPRQESQSNKSGDFKTVYFNAYCPKVMANVTGIEDILSDRTIKVVMQRAVNPIYSERGMFIDSDMSFALVRDFLYFYLLKCWKDVRESYLTIEKPEKITNRDWELWKPVLTFAKVIGDDVFYEMVDLAQEKLEIKQSEEASDVKDNLMIQALFEVAPTSGWYSLSEIKSVFIMQSDDLEAEANSRSIAQLLMKLGYQKKRMVHGKNEFYINTKQVETDISKRFKTNVRWMRLSISFEDVMNFFDGRNMTTIKLAELEQAFMDRFNLDVDDQEIEVFSDVLDKLVKFGCVTRDLNGLWFVSNPTSDMKNEISNGYHIIVSVSANKKSNLKNRILQELQGEMNEAELKARLREYDQRKVEEMLEKLSRAGEIYSPKIGIIKRCD